MTAQILCGDCRQILPTLPDCSIDAIVTDPPYELGFMGKAWDATGVAYQVDLWRECLRVLKPGGHLLAFGGSRTYHRLACAVEDAGFQVRDQIMWVYGSGFPKSLDVSKAIDKQRDDRADVYRVTAWIREARDAAGISNRDIDAAFGFAGMAGHWTSSKSQPAVPTLEQIPTLLDVLGVAPDDVPDDIRRLIWDLNGKKGQPGENWAKREVVGTKKSGIANKGEGPRHTIGGSKAVLVAITAPATAEAQQWQGWGTALKPAHEPIVLARKPLDGTVADNVLTHGTGGINIHGCRVAGALEGDPNRFAKTDGGSFNAFTTPPVVRSEGRWPANFIHDGSDEVLELFPDSKSTATRVSDNRKNKNRSMFLDGEHTPDNSYSDYGSAARFFYCAKASKKDRNEGLDDFPLIKGGSMSGGEETRPDRPTNHPIRANHHPTVKPTDLMRYLCRLVTPPNGTILDPFTGSGSTGKAAALEGFDFIGIEQSAEYVEIATARIRHAHQQT